MSPLAPTIIPSRVLLYSTYLRLQYEQHTVGQRTDSLVKAAESYILQKIVYPADIPLSTINIELI